MEFDNKLHDSLFKLFILITNEISITHPWFEEYAMDQMVGLYKFQYNDRSICEEVIEYEVWSSDDGMRWRNKRRDGFNKKIRFYFVEDEE